jgi:cytoskeleton protein RodZ
MIQNTEYPCDTETSLTGPGARLRLAREAARLTVNDVAGCLHLMPELIVAIENDDYSRAPRGVFLRGYMRSYAKLLNIPGDDIIQALERYYRDETAEEAPRAPERSLCVVERQLLLRYVPAALGVVLLFVVAVWWHWQSTDSVHTSAKTGETWSTTALAGQKPSAVKVAQTEMGSTRLILDVKQASTKPSPRRAVKQFVQIKPIALEQDEF